MREFVQIFLFVKYDERRDESNLISTSKEMSETKERRASLLNIQTVKHPARNAFNIAFNVRRPAAQYRAARIANKK